MNRTTIALALGTSLAVCLATSTAHGAAVATGSTTASTTTTSSPIQTLGTTEMSASTFNSLFQPYNTAMMSPFAFSGGSGNAGTIQSQVFQGTGAASGLYAYVYQVSANQNATDSAGEPVHVDSSSFKFGATPVGSDLTGSGKTQFGYNVVDSKLGGLGMSGNQAPAHLSWQAGQTTGFIRSNFVAPATQTPALAGGATSADYVLLSTQAPMTSNFNSVNVGGGSATTTVPLVYTPTAGTIEPIPVPEPATILAWAGMAGAVALVHRVRKTRQAQAIA
jgi:hypothetical protein